VLTKIRWHTIMKYRLVNLTIKKHTFQAGLAVSKRCRMIWSLRHRNAYLNLILTDIALGVVRLRQTRSGFSVALPTHSVKLHSSAMFDYILESSEYFKDGRVHRRHHGAQKEL